MILESPGTGLGLVNVMKVLGRSKMETRLRSAIWTPNG
jgi:hypothetical protein